MGGSALIAYHTTPRFPDVRDMYQVNEPSEAFPTCPKIVEPLFQNRVQSMLVLLVERYSLRKWGTLRVQTRYLPKTSTYSHPLHYRKANPSSRAILDMKNQRDKLHQYQRRITVLTSRETAIAKEMLAKGDKPRALLALRRKKYQESLLMKTDAHLEQLEKLTSSVEFALVQKDVVFGLQQGTNVLNEIHKEMGGIEHVEKLMGETADAIAYQNVCLSWLRCG
jgi:charged multivesicular body protein 6